MGEQWKSSLFQKSLLQILEEGKSFLQSDDDLPQRFFLGRSGTGTSSLIIDRLLDA